MPYDEALADRLRQALEGKPGVVQKKMFGGLSFMVQGHMCCGVEGARLTVRVGPDAHAEALAQPHAQPMDFTGRPMKGLVYVDPEGLASDAQLEAWVQRGLAFVATLKPK